jgi:hypothetical protein
MKTSHILIALVLALICFTSFIVANDVEVDSTVTDSIPTDPATPGTDT